MSEKRTDKWAEFDKAYQEFWEAWEKFTAPAGELLGAVKQAAAALGKVLCEAIRLTTILQGVNTAQLLKVVEVQAALKEAPPRVRSLAWHGKKYRTQKKNINRALREYQRRIKKA